MALRNPGDLFVRSARAPDNDRFKAKNFLCNDYFAVRSIESSK